MLYDEIEGFGPIIINGDLDQIKWFSTNTQPTRVI
jgi:hypothetical protein